MKLQLSCDGVSESKSTSISLDVYSIKFKGCRTIYPIRIVRPIKKINIDHSLQLNLAINDISDNGCTITHFIGDNPKRANAKKCLCFSSWYPCEYCLAKGTKVVTNNVEISKKKDNLDMQKKIVIEKIAQITSLPSTSEDELDKLKNLEKELTEAHKKLKPKKSNIVWPKSSANAPPRTREDTFEKIQCIENGQQLSIDEAKGVNGRSLLFDLPYFDFVHDVPVDYLHTGCLGVTKRCVELCFKVGENRPRITKRPLSSPLTFNRLISKIKVFKEFNRRVRDLDFAVYKGQEFRNLSLFMFPLIVKCFEDDAEEIDMWLYLAYMMRSGVLPAEEFATVSSAVIEDCCTKFYSIYQALFGVKNCTYNTHVFPSHLLKMRADGPLTSTSAFPFESFYGELRNAFVPGTVSTLKQIISNVLIKRVICNHSCEKEIYISAKDTPMECNSIVYCYSDQKYTIYKVISIEENDLLCQEIEKIECSFPQTPNVNWTLVGVFKKGLIYDEEQVIPRENVKGKVLIIDDLLITCPTNVLQEK